MSSQSHKHPDDGAQAELAQIRRTFRILKRTVLALGGVILLAVLIGGGIAAYHHFNGHPAPSNPVPVSIRHSVNFDVYYPDPSKLPADYTLNTRSFSSNGVAVVYRVDYAGRQMLAFSVQEKPSDSDLQNFNKTRLPLHTNESTNVGTATIGAIGNQTVVSLPTKGNAWLIITGPAKQDQKQLSQILQTIVLVR